MVKQQRHYHLGCGERLRGQFHALQSHARPLHEEVRPSAQKSRPQKRKGN